jgi:hypothetical protein
MCIGDGVVVAAAAQLSFRYNTTRRRNPDKETAASKRTILQSRLERQQGRMIEACAHGLTLATRGAAVRSSGRCPYVTVVAFFDDTETAHPVVQRRQRIHWRLARAEEQRKHGHRPRRQRRWRRPECSAARKFADGAVSLASILFSARKIVERHQ